ncbi:MAG: hypothetical protein ACOC3I_09025 [Verrucomicrobiota bacterium]
MADDDASPPPSPPSPPEGLPSHLEDSAERFQRRLFLVLQIIMGLGFFGALYERQWLTALVTAGIFGLMFVPVLLERRLKVDIPAEFEVLALLFLFASLFLGEVRGYYHRLWWWDIALHASSGLMLGILGFLLVYVLNETERIEIHMRPSFVALFAFFFAVAIGALWEIFEFSMDQLLGMNMQKPMLGDPSGLTDTMFDLILDTLGAFVISLLGWWHQHRRTHSFIDLWIRKFIARNPRLFNRGSS